MKTDFRPFRTSVLVALAASFSFRSSAAAQTCEVYTSSPIPIPGSTSYGIATGADGNLWYGASGMMIRQTPDGQTTQFPVPVGTPFAVAAGPDGNIWFNVYDFAQPIGKITPAGEVTMYAYSYVSSPGHVAAGPDGNVWFTYFCDDAAFRVTPSGVVTRFPVPTSGACVSGVTAGPDGNIWFTEHYRNKIGRMAPDGTNVMEFRIGPVDSGFPDDIAAGSDGFIYATDNNGGLHKVAPDGTLSQISSLGGYFGELISGGGDLWIGAQSVVIRYALPSGQVTTFNLPDSDHSPLALAYGSDGAVWFPEIYTGAIGRIGPPPVPTASSDGPVCAGSPLHLSASTVPGATYAWTGPNGFSSAVQNPTIASATPAESGTYSVTATVTGCASAPGTTSAVVEPAPSAAISAPSSVRSDSPSNTASVPDAGPGATYAWTIDNGTITSGAGTATVVFTAGAAGSVTVSVTVTDASGCSAGGSQTIAIFTPSGRVFLSAAGHDSSDCANPLTPCLTFAGALLQARVGGEVIASGTGGFGPLNITQAVTISGSPGVVVYSGLQVMINAPGATVVLRGLTIDGTEAVGSGIVVAAVGTLFVEGCVISGFAGGGADGNGIRFGSAGSLFVKDTLIRDNSNAGLSIAPASGTVTVQVDLCRFEGNQYGLISNAGGIVTASDSVASGNSVAGFATQGAAELNLEGCVAANNVVGITSSGAGALIRVSDSTVIDNVTGLSSANSGSLLSRGDNSVEGNLTEGTFSGTYSAK